MLHVGEGVAWVWLCECVTAKLGLHCYQLPHPRLSAKALPGQLWCCFLLLLVMPVASRPPPCGQSAYWQGMLQILAAPWWRHCMVSISKQPHRACSRLTTWNTEVQAFPDSAFESSGAMDALHYPALMLYAGSCTRHLTQPTDASSSSCCCKVKELA